MPPRPNMVNAFARMGAKCPNHTEEETSLVNSDLPILKENGDLPFFCAHDYSGA